MSFKQFILNMLVMLVTLGATYVAYEAKLPLIGFLVVTGGAFLLGWVSGIETLKNIIVTKVQEFAKANNIHMGDK